jgi:hypothetical protein
VRSFIRDPALALTTVDFRCRRMICRMTQTARPIAILTVLLVSLVLTSGSRAQSVPLDSVQGLQPRNVEIKPMVYQGRKSIQVMPTAESDSSAVPGSGGGGIVILPRLAFHNGTIELDVVGKPRAGAPGDARGFVGLAFRVNADASKYECVYIRPTNGRADDQLRRNHSTQYCSYPDYEWQRLRTESPGKYESYVDLQQGEWTKLKVEVSGLTMKLYVNGASQPALIVNDLKMGDAQGSVALWVGLGTEAYFANLRVTAAR